MNKTFFGCIFALGLLWTSAAFCRPIPTLTGPVVDEAKIFKAESRLKLSTQLHDLYAKTGVQLQVLTIPSLEGDSLEEFSIHVVDAWKLGKADTDKGLLLLFVQNDRKVRIEVGQGLEGQIPDALAGRIINQTMIPYFKKGDYEGGIIAGLQKIAQKMGLDFNVDGMPRSPPNTGPVSSPPAWMLIAFVLALHLFFLPGLAFLLGLAGYRGTRSGSTHWGGGRGGWSGGSGGGGWSGGGGGFSGGGASGRW